MYLRLKKKIYFEINLHLIIFFMIFLVPLLSSNIYADEKDDLIEKLLSLYDKVKASAREIAEQESHELLEQYKEAVVKVADANNFKIEAELVYKDVVIIKPDPSTNLGRFASALKEQFDVDLGIWLKHATTGSDAMFYPDEGKGRFIFVSVRDFAYDAADSSEILHESMHAVFDASRRVGIVNEFSSAIKIYWSQSGQFSNYTEFLTFEELSTWSHTLYMRSRSIKYEELFSKFNYSQAEVVRNKIIPRGYYTLKDTILDNIEYSLSKANNALRNGKGTIKLVEQDTTLKQIKVSLHITKWDLSGVAVMNNPREFEFIFNYVGQNPPDDAQMKKLVEGRIQDLTNLSDLVSTHIKTIDETIDVLLNKRSISPEELDQLIELFKQLRTKLYGSTKINNSFMSRILKVCAPN